MKFSEAQLRLYAESLKEEEKQKCKDAVALVRDVFKTSGYAESGQVALLCEDTLAYAAEMRNADEKVKIFIQGSCANDTNVLAQSDIDIAVVREKAFRKPEVEEKLLRDEVEKCLREKFGYAVERGNEVLKIRECIYQKDVNIMIGRRRRENRKNSSCGKEYLDEGIEIFTDHGERMVVFPEQHIVNGRAKNTETNQNFRRVVRIVKELRHLMEEHDFVSAKEISSFEIESLLWNLPNRLFTRYCFYRYLLEDVVEYLYRKDTQLPVYREINGIKPLCPLRGDLHKMSNFCHNLRQFYEYSLTED